MAPPDQKPSTLYKYGVDLVARARRNEIDPIIGREEEIELCIFALGRRSKGNPVLLGKTGVGKTAIVEGLARRIAMREVPPNLQDCEIVALDLASLLAGAKFRGTFEERIKDIIEEIKTSAGKIILFIDEIHTLVGAGQAEGSLDAANMLKPMLARREFRCIGATTDEEYRRYIEQDKALERRFTTIMVAEPTPEKAIAMVHALKPRLELHHQLKITDGAIRQSVALAKRYCQYRHLPDSAIDLLDQAGAMKQAYLSSKPINLRKLEEQMMLIQMELTVTNHPERQSVLRAKSAEFATKVEQARTQWEAERQLAIDLHDKKTKLELAQNQEMLAMERHDLEHAAEIKHSIIPKLLDEIRALEASSAIGSVTPDDIAHVIALSTKIPVTKLIESEKSRILHIEGLLRQRVIGQDAAIAAVADAVKRSHAQLNDENRPLGCFLFVGPTGVGKTELCNALADFLFDSQENLLRIDMSEFNQEHNVARLIGAPPGYIGHDQGGILTDAVRHRPYQVILCDEMEKAHPSVFNIFLQIMDAGRLTDGHGRIADFKNTMIVMTSNIGGELFSSATENVSEEVMDEVTDHFPPEFINRLDKIVLFNRLNIHHIEQILPNYIESLSHKLKSHWGINLEVTKDALSWIAHNGYSQNYGARFLRSTFEKCIINPLSSKLLAGEIERNCKVTVDCVDSQIVFSYVKYLPEMLGKATTRQNQSKL